MPYTVFMALFVVIPLFLVVFYAFTDGDNHFSLNNFKTVFTSPDKWSVIGMTFVVAFFTTFFCILIAYPIAYLLTNKKINTNKIVVYAFLFPMWINFVIRTVGLKSLLNGVTNSIFGWNITSEHPYAAIIIGMVYDYLPFAILPIHNQMLKMDRNQIEAAADLGANPFQVFVKTIIPMTIPGIVSAVLMTFMPTMSSYVIANKMSEYNKMIIGNTISEYFGTGTTNISHHIGSVLSLVMLLIIGISIFVQKSFERKDAKKKEGLW